ncbi:MAG: enoyl-CoA hydratase-related protein [Thermoanaerobaculia bacterium]
MKKIRVSTTSDTFSIELDAPPLNILDIGMLEELRDALDEVDSDRHLVVISAAGEKTFSAGASVTDHLGENVATMLRVFHDCFRRLSRLEVVSVALVKGVALGGGCELALGCDFVLASDQAMFGQPEINLGVFPPVAAWQLSHQISPRRGLEMILAGDSIDGATALQLGMVNAVFGIAEFDARAEAWLARLRRHSGSSLRLAKRAFRMASAEDFEVRLERIERMYLDELMTTDDANEGLAAFLGKRRPEWKHR